MSVRLVIPAGQTPATIAYQGLTWTEISAQARADGIENLGSPWCVTNEIVGLGFQTEKPPPPPPPVPSAYKTAMAGAVTLEDVKAATNSWL